MGDTTDDVAVKIAISDELGELEQTADCSDDDGAEEAEARDRGDGFDCAACGHRHQGTRLARICIGCACPLTAPPTMTPKEDEP